MTKLYYGNEAYKIIGLCMEVHRNLGPGFLEIAYKDAIAYELNTHAVEVEREKEYSVQYKDIVLEHRFFADFVVFEKIILEIKSVSSINDIHIAQVINYLKVSNLKLGLIVNFGEKSLEYQRVILG